MKTIYGIIFAFSIFLTSSAFAGNCGFGRIVCSDPVVEHFNVVDHVDVLQKRVEFDAEYFLGYNGYYDVVEELRAQEYVRDKDILLKQTEQVDKLISLLEQVLKQQTSTSDKDKNDKTEKQPKADKPKENDDNKTAKNIPLNNKVFKIFKEQCASCHSNSSKKAGLQLVGKDDDGTEWLADLPLEYRVITYDLVAGINLKERGKKLMPLGGPALSDEEVETIRLWMIAKAEELKKKGKDKDVQKD